MNSVWPSSTLTLDFQLLELWENKFVLFLNHWSVIIYFINSYHRKQCLLHRIIIPKRKRIFFSLFSIPSSVPKMGLVHTNHSAFTFDDGLPWWLRWWRICSQHGRPRFNPWVGKVYLDEEMAIHFSILAWRIPWTEEPHGLQSELDVTEQLTHILHLMNEWEKSIVSHLDPKFQSFCPSKIKQLWRVGI